MKTKAKKLKNVISHDEMKKKLFTKKEIKRMAEEYPKVKEKWEKMIMEEAADSIRKLRNEAGMTQEELAKMLHTSRTSVVEMESGSRNITLKTLIKTAKVMGKELEISFS